MGHILVAGGAGFIGSHTVLALRERGFSPLVLDNLSNGHKSSLEAIGFPDENFIEGDIRDAGALDSLFTRHAIDAVIHFAAFIEAGESVINPAKFYDNNVSGSLSLLQAMQRHGVDKIVFSSTAAVYGQSGDTSLSEESDKAPINPYGHSKWMVECMLRDTAQAFGLKAIALRYFNAAGSDAETRIGERHDPETHLIPLILQTAAGIRQSIKIFGTDYPTPDGTCIRDYIHVADLAGAHIRALDHLTGVEPNHGKGFYDAFNLGNGTGFSVREVIDTAKTVTGIDFTVEEAERRPGDPALLIAQSAKANEVLGWQPRYPALSDMIKHAWDFMQKNT